MCVCVCVCVCVYCIENTEQQGQWKIYILTYRKIALCFQCKFLLFKMGWVLDLSTENSSVFFIPRSIFLTSNFALSMYLAINQSIYLSIYQKPYVCVRLSVSIYLSIDLCSNLWIYLSIYLSESVCMSTSIYLCSDLSIYIYISESVCMCTSIYLSIYEFSYHHPVIDEIVVRPSFKNLF